MVGGGRSKSFFFITFFCSYGVKNVEVSWKRGPKLRFRFFSKFRFFWSDRDMSIFFGCQILPGFAVCLDFGKI